jgi:hypothetical protein
LRVRNSVTRAATSALVMRCNLQPSACSHFTK